MGVVRVQAFEFDYFGFKKNQKNQRPYHVVTGDEMTCVMVDVRWLLIVCVCVLKSDYGIYQYVYLITLSV